MSCDGPKSMDANSRSGRRRARGSTHLVYEILLSDDVRSSCLCFLRLLSLCEHCHAHGLSCSMRQCCGATDALVRFAGVKIELEGEGDGLVEAGRGACAHQPHACVQWIALQCCCGGRSSARRTRACLRQCERHKVLGRTEAQRRDRHGHGSRFRGGRRGGGDGSSSSGVQSRSRLHSSGGSGVRAQAAEGSDGSRTRMLQTSDGTARRGAQGQQRHADGCRRWNQTLTNAQTNRPVSYAGSSSVPQRMQQRHRQVRGERRHRGRRSARRGSGRRWRIRGRRSRAHSFVPLPRRASYPLPSACCCCRCECAVSAPV
jgi:hypothetical protein